METKRELADIEARMDAISAERADISRRWDDEAYTSHVERGDALASLSRLSREFDELFVETPEGQAASAAVDRHGDSCSDDIDRMLLAQVFPQLAKQSEATAGPLLKGVAGFLFGLITVASMTPKVAPSTSGEMMSLVVNSDEERDQLSAMLADASHLDQAELRRHIEQESRIHAARPEVYATPIR